MKILYDSQGFDMQRHGCVTRCFVELYKHLPQDIQAEFSVIETDNVYLNNIGFPSAGTLYEAFPFGRDNVMKKLMYKLYYNFKYGKYKAWDTNPRLNEYESAVRISKGDYDIFHPTFFSPYFLPYLNGKPFVLTVHDMIAELYTDSVPDGHSQVMWKKILIPKADHIVTVSECTKRDLQRMFNVPDDKISVIYHGTDKTMYSPSKERPLDCEYILYVGDRCVYKNFTAFVHAVIPILKRHKDLFVVCTGSPFNGEELRLLTETGVKDRFMQRFIKTDQEFMDVYHYATAFVYPSEYEGFGIPILEAYKVDCPVILNNASCFPEIAGDAATYVWFKDGKSDLEEKFETLYHLNGNERERLLEKQRKQLAKYTWEESAEKLAEVYRNVIK